MTMTPIAIIAAAALVAGCQKPPAPQPAPQPQRGQLYLHCQKLKTSSEALAGLNLSFSNVWINAASVELTGDWPLENNGIAVRVSGDMTLHSTNGNGSVIRIDGTNTVTFQVDTITAHGSSTGIMVGGDTNSTKATP